MTEDIVEGINVAYLNYQLQTVMKNNISGVEPKMNYQKEDNLWQILSQYLNIKEHDKTDRDYRTWQLPFDLVKQLVLHSVRGRILDGFGFVQCQKL